MRVLLVGFGGMGLVHYKNIQLIDGVEVVAVVGLSEQDQHRADEFNLPLFDTIDRAFEQINQIDVVDITTPTFLHSEHIRSSLKHNVDIICEKPLCLSSEEAQELYAEARRRGVSLVVAQVLRFTKEYQILKDLVETKPFGTVLHGSFTRLSTIPLWAKDGWLFDKEKSGLVPFDLHIHDLDMIISIFGTMNNHRVYRGRSNGSRFDEYYHVEYEYPSFTIHAEAGWLRSAIPFTATWRIIFEEGVVINDGSSIIGYPLQGDAIHYDISYDVVVDTGINVPPTGWYYEELRSIFECLQQNKPCTIVPQDEIITTLKILESL